MRLVKSLALMLVSLSTLVLASPQEMPKPAPELAKLKVFEGAWEGTGTAIMVPGMPEAKWTAQSTYAWVLDGFFLQADTSVAFEGMSDVMRFREFMGYDGENKRFVNLMVGNTGEVALTTLFFEGDDLLISMVPKTQEGRPLLERGLIKAGKDSMQMTMTFFGLDGPSRDGVKGTFKRVASAKPVPILEAKAIAPVSPEMHKLGRLVGNYEVAGGMTMMPGAPEMKIKGIDECVALFGGGVIQVQTKGAAEGMPGAYESLGFYGWRPDANRYIMSYISNMGDVGTMDAWLPSDNKIVAAMASLRMGMPFTSRMVMTLDVDGKVKSAASHSCIGEHDPIKDFWATYKLITK